MTSPDFSVSQSQEKQDVAREIRPTEVPVLDSHTRRISSRQRRSTKLGIFLFKSVTENLSPEQRESIAFFQERCNIQEVTRAQEIAHRLHTDPRFRANLKIPSFVVPVLPRPKRREQRRIGVGYKDKGTLRPSHKPRLPGERTLGYEEVMTLLGSWPSDAEVGSLLSPAEVLRHWRGLNLERREIPALAPLTDFVRTTLSSMRLLGGREVKHSSSEEGEVVPRLAPNRHLIMTGVPDSVS
jgi:hypothetical protein